MKPESMDAVFQALAHRDRRRVLDVLRASPGSTVGEVCEQFETSRIAVLKHLGVLEAAGLIVREREGRTKRLYLNAVPLRMIQDRWMSEFSSVWAGAMTAIKYRVEAEAEEPEAAAKPVKARNKRAPRSASARRAGRSSRTGGKRG